MSVTGISSSSFFQQAQELGGIAKDLQQIQKSLTSNDLNGAQAAFTQFLKDLQTAQPALLPPASTTPVVAAPPAAVTVAPTPTSTTTPTPAPTATTTPVSTPATSTTTPTTTTPTTVAITTGNSSSSGVSALQKDLQSLQQALTSGSLSDAKSAFAQLRSDLKSLASQGGKTRSPEVNQNSQNNTEININIVASGNSSISIFA